MGIIAFHESQPSILYGETLYRACNLILSLFSSLEILKFGNRLLINPLLCPTLEAQTLDRDIVGP